MQLAHLVYIIITKDSDDGNIFNYIVYSKDRVVFTSSMVTIQNSIYLLDITMSSIVYINTKTIIIIHTWARNEPVNEAVGLMT